MTPDPENVGPHDRPSISERLRSATAVAHERAEHAPFIDDLMSGRLDSGEYQRLAVQLYFVYEALERVGADLAGDPVADAVLDPKLLRLQRLGADLASFGIDPSTASPLPAVARYVTAIESTRDDPARYVAHHYTRYLGDLSGGQVVAHRMREHYGVDDAALSFYSFDGIDKLKRYKDAYRARLDALPLDAEGIERLVDEAIAAFDHNQAVFGDLDGARAA
ncbi:biliverdin-producing heme oxygenase [Gordonia hongkongensis]|uniref:Biliverdin-producing heme oxygenase n=1 Tax=Gordonia hongkongensis TaxID=1701090 RepID=A0AAX3T3T9_9ACTN|nr:MULTISPECIES: biliverdin-producing heme oxygenase [Gordonia]MBR7192842.1 biliverdin-producing heme oxygenase [Gordonia sp. SCSIO 19800]QIK47479.1 biliverdin-producing heme oxygenase [Gordonia terrae]WFP23482.1 biliverdin-producing heme oxygenase [Gordonia hongkongensis]